ncbi:protein YIPF1 [Leptopilina heterotoma]|uniref:protein YIPF1 n=1 Tax=Leptopilina heterotoma TaxID=63436 RepID=UPI001CA8B393|nr:protein YIPF1 [Leptopilina heterotoma]
MDDKKKNPPEAQFISFQDYSPIHRSGGTGQAQLDIGTSGHQPYVNFTNDPTGNQMVRDLEGMPSTEEPKQRNFWTVEYYQKFFNVNTQDVVERIKRSMIPHWTDNYLKTHIEPNPDLYGPFWICVTLVFSIAVSGNIANYFQTANSEKYHWKYDFHVISGASTCIFLYAWLLPLALWGALKWTANQPSTQGELIEETAQIPGLLQLLCLYGYSLSIYVPVAFLWTIQYSWLQWGLVIAATVLSGGVLLLSLLPVVSGKHKYIYVSIILGLHLLLAAGFMLYFFHVPTKNVTEDIATAAPKVLTQVTKMIATPTNTTH